MFERNKAQQIHIAKQMLGIINLTIQLHDGKSYVDLNSFSHLIQSTVRDILAQANLVSDRKALRLHDDALTKLNCDKVKYHDYYKGKTEEMVQANPTYLYFADDIKRHKTPLKPINFIQLQSILLSFLSTHENIAH